MSINKCINKVYGYEDYATYMLPTELVDGSTWIRSLWANEGRGYGTYMIKDAALNSKTETGDYGIVKFDGLIRNHKELLSTAKTVYVHPSCSISRSLLTTKYKKSLSPWVADAVVIPDNLNQIAFWPSEVALFINETAKCLFIIRILEEVKDRLSNYPLGSPLQNIAGLDISNIPDANAFGLHTLNNAGLLYVGDLVHIPNSQGYLVDIITGALPTEKTAFEQSVIESLSDESNKITLENLVSIREMLNSTDDNTVSAALKALSTMDYTHYKNSVKKMLSDAGSSYLYNKAVTSTSVKYMINFLYGTTNRRRIYYYSDRYEKSIHEEDYKLFCQYVCHELCIPEQQVYSQIMNLPFMTTDAEGHIIPNLA